MHGILGAVCGVVVERVAEMFRKQQRKSYWEKRNGGNGRSGRENNYSREFRALSEAQNKKPPDAADQLRTVMAADFVERPLLNRPEAAVFKALDAAVIARNPDWQVMAQVSLGEFLASKDKDAYLAINSKRVDFALMDENARVRFALEDQGSGHHLPDGAAAARDAGKKAALRKAGVGYHEMVSGHTTPSELRRLVEKLVPARPEV